MNIYDILYDNLLGKLLVSAPGNEESLPAFIVGLDVNSHNGEVELEIYLSNQISIIVGINDPIIVTSVASMPRTIWAWYNPVTEKTERISVQKPTEGFIAIPYKLNA